MQGLEQRSLALTDKNLILGELPCWKKNLNKQNVQSYVARTKQNQTGKYYSKGLESDF